MEKDKMPMLQIVAGTNEVDMLKLIVSSLYVEWLDDLLEEEVPKEESFESKEEYEKACKAFMVDLVDQAKEYKGDIFKGVLESYNTFLSQKYQFATESKEKCEYAKKGIAKTATDMRRRGIIMLFLALLFPKALLFILLFNGSKMLIDAKKIKRLESVLEQTSIENAQIESIQDSLFWFTDSLRTDYHNSNEELEELREKARKGENIIPALMELMSPERLSLPRRNILKELEFILPDEMEKETKGYIKKKIESN